MSWRDLMPAWYRDRKVEQAIRKAEHSEAVAANGTEAQRVQHGREAILWYLEALRWRPFTHAGELPGPQDNPVSEDARGGPVGVTETIPCVLCGTPIARRASDAREGPGLYCTACA